MDYSAFIKLFSNPYNQQNIVNYSSSTTYQQQQQLLPGTSDSLMNGDFKFPANNSTSSLSPKTPFNKDADLVLRKIVAALELLVCFVGTPANAFVLYLACTILYGASRRRRRAGGLNEALDVDNYRPQQVYILSMTIYDLLFCLIHAPMMFVQMLPLILRVRFSLAPCMIMYSCSHFTMTASSLSLLLLNVDKYLSLSKPLHYASIMTHRRSIISVLIVATVSSIWAVFLMFGPFMENSVSKYGQCIQRIKHPGVYVFFAAQFFILPTLISLAISGFTLVVALKSSRRRNGNFRKRVPSVSISTRSILTTNSEQKKVLQHQKQKSSKVFKLIGFTWTTSMWTGLTVLPYRMAYVAQTAFHLNLNEFGRFFIFALFALMIFNAAGNPFITLITKRQYSNRAKKIITLIRKRIFRSECLIRASSSKENRTPNGEMHENFCDVGEHRRNRK